VGERTEELRREIESTRDDLGYTIDAIGDRVSPSRVIERRKNRITGGVRGAVDKVMGKAHDARSSVSDAGHGAVHGLQSAGHGAVEGIHGAPDTLKSSTQGAPVMAGVVAFAAGFIAAALIPPTEKEQQGASKLAEKLEPVKAELSSVGQELAEHLKEPAQQAAQDLKSTAQEGVQSVTETAKDAKQGTVDQVKDSVDTVKSGDSESSAGSTY